MTVETFFEKFELFTGTPEAVEKMRDLVRSLAVQAKLVEQDAADGVAEVEDPADARYEIPGSWAWISFADVGEQRLGKMLDARKNRGTLKPYLRNTNVQWMRFELADVKEMRLEEDELEEFRLRAGDLLICEGGEPGRCAIWRDDVPEMYFQKAIHRVRPRQDILPEYLAINLRVDTKNGVLDRFFTGATIKHLTGRSLREYSIPLPPLAEQKRIVAKVDELMALCDRLEAQQHQRETRHAALARASLTRFAEAPTPSNLQFLFHKSYDIAPADLRKSILTLAVQGKLVPQDPNDEPAEKALARLEARGGNAKTRRSVPTGVSRPDTLDVENLPESWCIESTARLLQLGAISDLKDGNHGANHPKVAEFTETGLPFITAAQVSDDGQIDYEGAYKVSGDALKRLRVGFAKPNDVIYTHKGSVGRVAICDRECVLTPQTTYYRVNEEMLSSGFVRVNLLSPLFRDQVDLVKRQTTRDFVSINAQYQFFLRVPPLAEQRRIVAKVEQLIALVDALEQHLAASRATATKLLEALVAELTAASSRDRTARPVAADAPAAPAAATSRSTSQRRPVKSLRPSHAGKQTPQKPGKSRSTTAG